MNGKLIWTMALVALISIWSGAAPAAPLDATIELAPSGTTDAPSAIDVRFTLSNSGPAAATVLTWGTPLDGITGDMFHVTRNGRSLRYLGIVVSRGEPQAEDYIELPPGGSTSSVVRLSSAYDMSRPGRYKIRLRLGRADIARSTTPVTVVVGRTDQVALPELLQPEAPVARAAGFINCNAQMMTDAATAETDARGIATKAARYMKRHLPQATGPIYNTWFGVDGNRPRTLYDRVRDNFSAILKRLDGKTARFQCKSVQCKRSWYAFVYPDDKKWRIHLCDQFWPAPATGMNSKAGTVVHEMSHFKATAGTKDHVYGEKKSKALAKTSPPLAADNADNHEFFAESQK